MFSKILIIINPCIINYFPLQYVLLMYKNTFGRVCVCVCVRMRVRVLRCNRASRDSHGNRRDPSRRVLGD